MIIYLPIIYKEYTKQVLKIVQDNEMGSASSRGPETKIVNKKEIKAVKF